MIAASGALPERAVLDGARGESPSEPQPTPTRSTTTSATLRSLRFQPDIAHSGFE
jgi:hypothetical protein